MGFSSAFAPAGPAGRSAGVRAGRGLRAVFAPALVLLALLFCLLAPAEAFCREAEPQEPAKWYEQVGDWLSDSVQLSGWLETIHGTRLLSTDEPITSRVQGRAEAAVNWSSFYGFVSLDAELNWIVDQNSHIAPREAWLEYASDSWSLRFGRQIIVWGKADGLRVTDNICPVDYSDFMNRNLDNMRIPVTAALLRLSGETLVTDLVWIPEFRPAVFPERDDPWGALFSFSDSPYMRMRDSELPPFSLENSEFGMRVAGYFSNFDISASVLHTWDDLPVYDSAVVYSAQGPYVEITPKYKRMTVLGLDVSVPWSDFVFRAEGAVFLDRHLTALTPGDSVRRKNTVKWLVGVDWSPGGDWSVTAQFSDEQILDYEEDLNSKEHRHTGTLNISKKFLNQTLTVSNMLYVMTDDRAWADRFQVEYSLMDGMTIAAGIDWIDGSDGTYREMTKNSQIWTRLKYSF
ncbi:MAG: hypothetical protein Q4F72_04015 [Desulfovibrionaceae bacterium]|nr:hypothetical protein [Desulfovibrionaceae bacterium]